MKRKRSLPVRIIAGVFEPASLGFFFAVHVFLWLPVYLFVSLGLRSPLSGNWQFYMMEFFLYAIPPFCVYAVLYKIVKRELASRDEPDV